LNLGELFAELFDLQSELLDLVIAAPDLLVVRAISIVPLNELSVGFV
jgi:hypothetical protein